MTKLSGKLSAYALTLSILFILLSGCSVKNRIFVENDIVTSTKRVELKLEYRWHNRRSPITFMEQTIVKEIADSIATYRIYDVLMTTSLSYRFEEKVFMIIDNQVFKMNLNRVEFENSKTIEENKENIMRTDSTSVSVVTGYTENNLKITRFSYQLPENSIPEIRRANKVLFRYYTGPEMATVKLSGYKLMKFKQLIDKE